MQNLNSDELREVMKENTLRMNALTEENDLIVKLLKQRGLYAVDPEEDASIPVHDCVMQLDKLHKFNYTPGAQTCKL